MDAPINTQPTLPTRPVYHYTSQRGLLGIITDKKIWATNILYMNDATELAYAIDLAHREIIERKKASRDEDIPFLEEIHKRLSVMTWFDTKGIYVCSFSTEPDQLSQWRGYCPDGTGYSIGFDFCSPLCDCIKRQGFHLSKCVYKENEQLEILRPLLTEAIDTFHKQKQSLAGRADQYVQVFTSIEFNFKFLEIAPRLKHPKFSEENEWRLISPPVSLDHPQVKFREGRSMLIPYFEFKLAEGDEPLSIPEIWVGPTPHSHLSRSSVSSVLIAKKVTGSCRSPDNRSVPCVRISEIPYCAW